MAAAGLCVILSHMTVVYSHNDCMCCYDKFEYEFEFYKQSLNFRKKNEFIIPVFIVLDQDKGWSTIVGCSNFINSVS